MYICGMKKIMTIGDIHGRTSWKDFGDIKFLLLAEPEAAGYGGFVPEFDYYIFGGDYCDSFTESNVTIAQNLLEIIRFKTLYPNHVILLWGNHDVNYYRNLPWIKMNGYVAGFRVEAHYELFQIFNDNRDLFQIAFQEKNYLFTHAGVHYGWYHFVFKKAIKGLGFDDMTVAEQSNEAFRYRIDCIMDNDFRRGGTKKVGGPLWCSKELIDKKPLRNMHQIVGHTATEEIVTYKINNATSITFCDVLHKTNMCYIIEI